MMKTNKLQDSLIVLLISALTLTAFYLSYGLTLSGPVVSIVWIFWLLTTMGLAYFTSPGQSVYAFAKLAKVEMTKVIWPSRKETIQTTSIVVVMVTAAGFLLWLADTGMMWIIGKITHLG